jgi:predicted MFS family arabinose efflux permease
MTVETAQERSGIRTFYIVWSGQLVSLVGTSLTAFGLSIFIFLETGSVTRLAAVMFAGLLPRLVIGPFAGALVDRWDRRKVMLLSDLGAGVGTMALVALYFTDNLALWNILLAVAFSGVFQAFQWPAYNAAMQVLVPQEQLGRAAGLVQLAEAIGNIGGPVIAGFLIAVGGVGGIFFVDMITFLFAVGTLLLVRFPKPVQSEAGAEGAGTLWEETKYGFKYVWERHGLFALMLYFAMINLAFGFLGPLFIPLGLSVTGPAQLGTAFAIGSTGMLVGGLIASIWGGPKHRIAGIVISGGVLGLAMIAVGFRASIIWIAAIVWIAMSVVPIMSASSQALWLSKVEPDLQGRISAVRMTVAQIAIPVSYLLVGPLADYVFEPLMADDGPLAGGIGSIIGSGPGRGYALFFMVLGFGVIVVSVVAWLYPPLRHVEAEIPDVEFELTDEDETESEVIVDLEDVSELPVV